MFFKRNNKSGKKKGKITSSLCDFAKQTDAPLELLRDCSYYEINSNKEVMVEGCKGIIQYEENLVKLNMQNMITVFCGRNLQIKCLTKDSLVITGFVTSVQFVV